MLAVRVNQASLKVGLSKRWSRLAFASQDPQTRELYKNKDINLHVCLPVLINGLGADA